MAGTGPASARMGLMRVPRTFAFVDLSGFTAYTDANGDERAGEMLSRFRAVVRSVTSDHAVRVAKWQGDGAMFVSVTPEPLVDAVLEVTERLRRAGVPLPLRAGLTTGEVILFEGDDYIGRDVNLASRLCDAAQPGELLAVTELAPFVPYGATAETAGEVAVRGFALPVSVMRVSRRSSKTA